MFLREFIADKFVMLIELAGLGIGLIASVHIPKRMQKWTFTASAETSSRYSTTPPTRRA